ncbi:hypothetical protein [Pararhizobium gei]|uniref:hypothetical protein n=1 Tax=Pararhizobium gei TaxID=1395951 RepID=UPI0023DB24E6|nr:hypothetical protein [Rhizobium gei]
MARLLQWPLGVRWNRWKALNGPQSIGSSASTSIGDVTQSIASPFGARHLQFSFPPMRGVKARRMRGTLTALHMGANAVRVSICDFDGMSRADAGMALTADQQNNGLPFGNGLSWSNGQNWNLTKPHVKVSEFAAFDSTIIRLSDTFWGRQLGMGDMLGFFPFHFGLYEVTKVFGNGRYRIWPPLRKAVTNTDYATLRPVLAMRLLSSNLPDADRGPVFLEGLTVSLFEVFDYDLRDYFKD